MWYAIGFRESAADVNLQRSLFIEIVWSWHRDRSLMLAFVLDRRVTSTNFLLHPYLRFPHSSSFSAYYAAKQFVLLHWRVRPVASVRSDRPTVTHHGIMPRYPIIDLFKLGVCVIISKSGRSCALTKCYFDVFFSNARWLFDHFQLSKQSVSVTLHISLNIYRQLLCGNFLVKTDDKYSTIKAHLLNFRHLLFFLLPVFSFQSVV